jgi:hypothetical protein
MNNDKLKQKLRKYYAERDRLEDEYDKWYSKECAKISAKWRKNPILYPKAKLPSYPFYRPPSLPFPDELRGLT